MHWRYFIPISGEIAMIYMHWYHWLCSSEHQEDVQIASGELADPAVRHDWHGLKIFHSYLWWDRHDLHALMSLLVLQWTSGGRPCSPWWACWSCWSPASCASSASVTPRARCSPSCPEYSLFWQVRSVGLFTQLCGQRGTLTRKLGLAVLCRPLVYAIRIVASSFFDLTSIHTTVMILDRS